MALLGLPGAALINLLQLHGAAGPGRGHVQQSSADRLDGSARRPGRQPLRRAAAPGAGARTLQAGPGNSAANVRPEGRTATEATSSRCWSATLGRGPHCTPFGLPPARRRLEVRSLSLAAPRTLRRHIYAGQAPAGCPADPRWPGVQASNLQLTSVSVVRFHLLGGCTQNFGESSKQGAFDS